MGDPHNPKRAGEVWDQDRINVQLAELESIKDLVAISGGWAWHFMSPKGHKEIKTQHDHKDIDIFIKPEQFEVLRTRLALRGFKRQHTQWDNPSVGFYRFTLYYEGGKVVYDVFLEDIEFVEIDGFKIVEPNKLVSLYGIKHTSEQCLAVQAARKLLKNNISPIGRSELVYE